MKERIKQTRLTKIDFCYFVLNTLIFLTVIIFFGPFLGILIIVIIRIMLDLTI